MKSDTEPNNNNNTEEPKINMVGDEEKKDGDGMSNLQRDDAEASVPKKKSEIQIVDGNWVSRCALLCFFLFS